MSSSAGTKSNKTICALISVVLLTLTRCEKYSMDPPCNPETSGWLQGPCNAGYVDMTENKSYDWSCGANCIGGQNRTDSKCNCACVPDIPCADTWNITTMTPSNVGHDDTNDGHRGCSNTSRQRQVILNKIYACPGVIKSGGLYGKDAQSLCHHGYHVCNSAKEAQSLGLTAEICDSIDQTGKEFFGTKESSNVYGECASDSPGHDSYNDVWGCGTGTFRFPCNNNTLTSSIGDNNINGWVLNGDPYHEATSYSLTSSEGGGVLCCVDHKPMENSNLTVDIFLKKYSNIIIFGVVVLVLIIVFSVCLFNYRKSVNKVNQEIVIKNAMVILIAIGIYEDNPSNPDEEMKHVHLEDLYVKQDIVNLCKLFGADNLNYSIFPQYKLHESKFVPKLHWTEDEIMSLLSEKAEELNNLLNDNRTKNKFDGLVVAISSHGISNNICTSDFKLISKDAIHRVFSASYPSLRKIPRIHMFDCCDGFNDYVKVIDTDDEIKESTKFIRKITDQTKQIVIKDVEGGKITWKIGDKNPDHKLVEIHSANRGFQAKCNSNIGSYMLSKFVENTLQHLNGNKTQQKFIHQIFDEIEEELQETGKQKIKTIYNDKTRYIVFKKNNTYTNHVTNNNSKDKCFEEIKINTIQSNDTTHMHAQNSSISLSFDINKDKDNDDDKSKYSRSKPNVNNKEDEVKEEYDYGYTNNSMDQIEIYCCQPQQSTGL